MILNYEYKLYVNKHTKELSQLVTTANYVRNHIVALYRRYYKLYGKRPSENKVKSHIARLTKKNPYWKLMGSQSMQELTERVENGYKRFFDKLSKRPPKFHKVDGYGSFIFKGKTGYALNGNTLVINKLKRTYKFKLTRPYDKIKNIKIYRDNLGQLWLIVNNEVTNPKTYERHENGCIGMDFGLKTFITTSDNVSIDAPLPLKNNLKRLRKLSRNLSKKKMGSNGRRRAKKELAKLYERITNQRTDFHWKLAHELCKTHSYIAIEDLNLNGMIKRWGRKVSDLGWGLFVLKLEEVALKYGTKLVKIGRFEASSQICHCCGYKNSGTKDLSVREWICPQCGAIHDRDVNAAINILNISLKGKDISLGSSDSKSKKVKA